MVIEGQAFIFCLQAEHGHQLLHQQLYSNLIAVQVQAASLDLGNIQQPLYQIGEVLTAAANDAEGFLAVGGNGLVVFHQLGIAEDGIERGTEFVTDPRQVATFRPVGGLRLFLCLLKSLVGPFVGDDLFHQEAVLATGLFLGDYPAFMGEHEQPADHAGHDHQNEEHLPQGYR